MTPGFLNIILHAHLPYVRHPEYPHFFEENWLFEAITECYLPLLGVLERLQHDQIDYRLTLSLSPTLISMLSDELLQSRYQGYLQRALALAEQEIIRTRRQPEYQGLARLYRRFFANSLQRYQQQYQGDLLQAFKSHAQSGYLELITTAATHGFLPLLNSSETAVRNQIDIGLNTFNEHFGFKPAGFWLPECGYYPGLEKILKTAGIDYFFVETHGLLNAIPAPESGVYLPLQCDNGVVAFGRDPDSAQQVWSAETGYPGDADYREYYSDIGFILDEEYLAPYMLDGHTRINTGIKYQRITNGELDKALYNPKAAQRKVLQHAQDFVAKRQQQLARLQAHGITAPVIVAPYDAELFGHWWFEGPCWLENVLRLASAPNSGMQLSTGLNYLKQHPNPSSAKIAASSWGEQGYSQYWLNESNDWIYPLLYKAETELEKLVVDLRGITLSELQSRLLKQAIRSLLLAQASDWPFMMKSGSSLAYAHKSINDHLARFNYCHDSLRKNRINERYLSALEMLDNIFPTLETSRYDPLRNSLSS